MKLFTLYKRNQYLLAKIFLFILLKNPLGIADNYYTVKEYNENLIKESISYLNSLGIRYPDIAKREKEINNGDFINFEDITEIKYFIETLKGEEDAIKTGCVWASLALAKISLTDEQKKSVRNFLSIMNFKDALSSHQIALGLHYLCPLDIETALILQEVNITIHQGQWLVPIDLNNKIFAGLSTNGMEIKTLEEWKQKIAQSWKDERKGKIPPNSFEKYTSHEFLRNIRQDLSEKLGVDIESPSAWKLFKSEETAKGIFKWVSQENI